MKKSNKRKSARLSSRETAKQTSRRLLLENLEDRRLLAGAPELVAVTTNAGDQIYPEQRVLEYSPSELVLRFNEAAEIDVNTLDGISIVSSGHDGVFSVSSFETDFNTGGDAIVRFTSRVLGDDGNDISVDITRTDHGNATGPYVKIDAEDDHKVIVDLNTNDSNPTTVGQLVEAINGHAQASRLINVELMSGNTSRNIAEINPNSYLPLEMQPTDDITLTPGYIGLNETMHDVVLRVSNDLEQGKYRLVIPGEGPTALRDIDGTPLGQLEDALPGDDGQSSAIEFEVELGAKVLAVVPQPVVNSNGLREQLRDRVLVYFNNDDLNKDTAEDPANYQLIFTNDTIENTDDIAIKPISVKYDQINDFAELRFSDDLDKLVPGGGNFRLRIGDANPLASKPIINEFLGLDAGDHFDAALDIGQNITVQSDGLSIEDGDSFALASSDGESHLFEFDLGTEITVVDVTNILNSEIVVSDGVNTETFVIVDDPAAAGPTQVAVVVGSTPTATEVRDALSQTLIAEGFGFTQSDVSTDGLHLGWDTTTVVSSNSASLDVVNQVGVNPDASAIRYRSDFDSLAIAHAIQNSVNSQDAQIEADVNVVQTTSRIATDLGSDTTTTSVEILFSGVEHVRMADIHVLGSGANLIDGDLFIASSQNGRSATYEIDLGYVLHLPRAIDVIGETLVVTHNGQTETLEFVTSSSDASVGNIPVVIPADSAGNVDPTLESGVFDALVRLSLESAFGSDVVVELMSAASDQSGQQHFTADGELEFAGTAFSTSDNTASFYQLSSLGVENGNVAISIKPHHTLTQDAIANAIAEAISQDNEITNVVAVGSNVSVQRGWAISYEPQPNPVVAPSFNAFATPGHFTNNSLESIRFVAAIGGDQDALRYPGHVSEPGHRDIPFEHHTHALADSNPAIPVYNYSFPVEYATDVNGNILKNSITEIQKRRVREVFDIYGYYIGAKFVESDSSGIKIALGDMSSLDPMVINQKGGQRSIARPEGEGVGTIVLDFQDFQDVTTERFGELWFREVMMRAGQILGMGQSYELPPQQVFGDEPLLEFINAAERVFPGDHDITHGQLLYRPDGNDIDVYTITLDEPGDLEIELLAERLPNPSTLDAVISVYRDGELVGRNQKYFSDDPRLTLESVEAGKYSIAVSAAGNDQFDLNVPGTGAGGLTTGRYELNVVFSAGSSDGIVDVDGSKIDGDLDGLAGGIHNSWLTLVGADAGIKISALSGETAEDVIGRLATGDSISVVTANGSEVIRVIVRNEAPASHLINVNDGMSIQEFADEISSTLSDIDSGIEVEVVSSGNEHILNVKGIQKLGLDITDGAFSYVGRTLFVAKGESGSLGTIESPFSDLQLATHLAQEGDVLRVMGSPGDDGDDATLADNSSYQLGFSLLNGMVLEDGSSWVIPAGVTAVVDGGAIFKMRRGSIVVGSTSPLISRNGAALQILGTPFIVDKISNLNGEEVLVPRTDSSGDSIDGSVRFTSIFDSEIGVDSDPYPHEKDAAQGDWGGIVFLNDLDNNQDHRDTYEMQGVFLNIVNNAVLEYGGGTVMIDGVSQEVSPVDLVDSRPTLTNLRFQSNANAAISATPDSFVESTFHDALSQTVVHTPDYDRVGPVVRDNQITENSINGLLISVETPIASDLLRVTKSTRWDDTDIVHVVPENILLEGNPGGLLLESVVPPSNLIMVDTIEGGQVPIGTHFYKLTYVDALGNESLSSDATLHGATTDLGQQKVVLNRLPIAPEGFVARRVYRSMGVDSNSPVSANTEFRLVGEINASVTSFIDDGTFLGGMVDDSVEISTRPRLHGSLIVDPGAIVKLDAARIDALLGSHLFAEGTTESPVVFTSLTDQRFGEAGTFDTRNSGSETNGLSGDWGGVYVGPTSLVSMDYTRIAFGGGTTRELGTFATFNAVEVHQGDLRLTHSVLENNASGIVHPINGDGSQSNPLRGDYSTNDIGVIFVRGAQPVIMNNTFRDNLGVTDSWTGDPVEMIPAININVNSMRHEHHIDSGRQTVANFPGGPDARRFDVPVTVAQDMDNHGPLVSGNVLDNNNLNGMVVRGGTITTEVVWDDTDIVHVLFDEIVIPDLHTFGGMRLESSSDASLIVKSRGDDAGIRAIGRPLDIDDRIGGSLHVVGNPRYNVYLTSLCDYTVGAGLDLNGDLQVLTDNGLCGGGSTAGGTTLPTGPEVDNGTLIDNDVNTPTVGHFEFQPLAGGSAAVSGVTVQGTTLLEVNSDFIFDYINYVDVSADGDALRLENTTITTPPTLIGDDLVLSEGNFAGENATIDWRVETHLNDGEAVVYNTLTLSSSQQFGDLRFITYLDEDILLISDDILWPTGDATTNNLRLYTLDGPERFGFSQAGETVDGSGLDNATFVGWAADQYPQLQDRIEGNNGETFTLVGNIDTNDLVPFIDPELGQVYGPEDITTALAWDVDATATSATIVSFLELIPQNPVAVLPTGEWKGISIEEFAHDENVHIVTEYERLEDHFAGDVNDGRYIDPITGEVRYGITEAQHLGRIADNLKSGDENARLGFKVHGFIASPAVDRAYASIGDSDYGDTDTYRFEAKSETEIWLDIDNSSSSLDSVIELVDANGNILARSDNSTNDEGLEHDATRVRPYFTQDLSSHVNDLTKSSHGIYDHWTVNHKDAGLRVVLPGTPGAVNSYYVRVYSQSDTPVNDITETNAGNGSSWGVYQLNIRLREEEMLPGSMIQFTDIRSAESAVTIMGQPLHSPLLGEASEVLASNDTVDTAQPLGNLFNTDKGTLSLAGEISDAQDVDWYQFNVEFDSTHDLEEQLFHQQFDTRYGSVILDIDYADGLGGPNTAMSLFQMVGGTIAVPVVQLVAVGEDSNIADDRAKPLSGIDVQDLARGTVGGEDPFIGPIALEEGIYFVAVYPESIIPNELSQGFQQNAATLDIRVEPLEHFERVVEDRINDSQGNTQSRTDVFMDDEAVVPLHLGDVPLVVTQGWGPISVDNPVRMLGAAEPSYTDLTADQTNVWVIDPLTGMSERRDYYDANGELRPLEQINIPCGTLVTQPEGSRADTLGSFRDIAMRQDGTPFGYTVTDSQAVGGQIIAPPTVIGGWSDEQAGDYHSIDIADCSSSFIGEDDVETYEPVGNGTNQAVRSNQGDGHGIQFEALSFGWPTNGGIFAPTGLAVGNRPAFGFTQQADGSWERFREVHEGNMPAYDLNGLNQEMLMHNLLYRFDINSGEIINHQGQADRAESSMFDSYAGAATNKREIGQLLTDWVNTVDVTSSEQLFANAATSSVFDTNKLEDHAIWEVHDDDLVPIDLNQDGMADVAFQWNSGPDVRVAQEPNPDNSSELTYVEDGDRFFLDGQAFEFDTGASIVVGGKGNELVAGYIDIAEDPRYLDPNIVRFHIWNQGDSRTTPLLGGGANRGDVFIQIPDSESVTESQIAAILANAIQDATVDDPNDDFRVRATQHPGDKYRVTLEFDSGTVNTTYKETERFSWANSVETTSHASCFNSDSICVHGSAGISNGNTTYNGKPIVRVNQIGNWSGSQITWLNEGLPGEYWGHVEETTSWQEIVQAIRLATNGSQLAPFVSDQWQRAGGVGGINNVASVVVPQVVAGVRQADSLDDRLNFLGFEYAIDSLGPYVPAPSIAEQNGFDELLVSKSVFTLDYNYDGIIDPVTEVMRNGVKNSNPVYLLAKETELQNTPPNSPTVPLGVSSLTDADIFTVSFGAAYSNTAMAAALSDAINTANANPVTKIHQDKVKSTTDQYVVILEDLLHIDDVNINLDGFIDLNGNGLLDPTEEIELLHAEFMVPDIPLRLASPAPGGLVTGMAWLYDYQTEADTGVDANQNGVIEDVYHRHQPRLFVVTDTTNTSSDPNLTSVGGGVYELTNPLTSPTLTFLPNATEFLGTDFQGLAAGPPHVEDGRYSETLFAIDSHGDLFAFDITGERQEVFADGTHRISTGIRNANGLDFSNLDYNLWHQTDSRANDVGHGVNASNTSNRQAETGQSSLHFSMENVFINDVLDPNLPEDRRRVQFDDPNILNNAGRATGSQNYEFPGGAHGSVISHPFSLRGYAPGDQALLLFNYFLETDDGSGELEEETLEGIMTDAFRVYISVDNGQWELLSTNNAFSGPSPLSANDTDIDDEFDLDDRGNMREVYDTAEWRQASIRLSEYAGEDNVRIRFDFLTSGANATGDVLSDALDRPIYPVGGQELVFRPGYQMTDGSTITIDAGLVTERTFEFDLGYNMVIPSGIDLTEADADGDWFELIYRIGHDLPSTQNIDERELVKQVFVLKHRTDGDIAYFDAQIDSVGRVELPFNSGLSADELTTTWETLMRQTLERLTIPTSGTTWIVDPQVQESQSVASADRNSSIQDLLDTSDLANSFRTELTGGNFRFRGQSFIGDINDDASTPTVNEIGSDVDFWSVEAGAGDVIDLKIDTTVTIGENPLVPHIRAFRMLIDGEIEELTKVPAEVVQSQDATLSEEYVAVHTRIVAPSEGTIFIAISSVGNQSYDSLSGSGVVVPLDGNGNELFDASRPYNLEIEIQNPRWPLIRHNLNELQLLRAVDLQTNFSAGNSISISGVGGVNDPATGNIAVPVWVDMRADEVADSFRDRFAHIYANDRTEAVKSDGNRVFVMMHEVTDSDQSITVVNALEGDASGNFYSNQAGVDNAFEGLYIDDIMIGATERGVLVTAAGNDSTFINNPYFVSGDTFAGTYQLEIRRASEFGEAMDTDSGAGEYAITNVYDVNHRFAPQRSIVMPAGANLIDGMELQISDGVDTVIFEFNDLDVGDASVKEGNQAIPFHSGDADYIVARSFVAAVNSDAVQRVELDLQAAAQDFGPAKPADQTTSNVVDLFGNALFDVYTPFLTTTPTVDASLLAETLNSDLEISNAILISGPSSAGGFEGGKDVFGFYDGIVLSTGDVATIADQNSRTKMSGLASGVPSDSVFDLTGVNTVDSTTLSFEFIATGTELFLNAVFASEEYPDSTLTAPVDQVVVSLDDLSDAISEYDRLVLDDRLGTQVNSSVIRPVELHSSTFNADTLHPAVYNAAGLSGEPLYGITGCNLDGIEIEDCQREHLYRDNSFKYSGVYLNEFAADAVPEKARFPFDGFTDVLKLHTDNLQIGNRYRMTISIADAIHTGIDSAIFLSANSLQMANGPVFDADDNSVVGGLHFDDFGDFNTERLQGQIIIDSNTLDSNAEYGINVEAGPRTNLTTPLAGEHPHPGSARILGMENVDNLAPGVVISNNIIINNEAAQIRFAGEADTGTGNDGPVPFGRIFNNTIVADTSLSTSSADGIVVENNASPTIINNVIAFASTGISVDSTSETTVIGGNVYADNAGNVSQNVTEGDFSTTANGTELFLDAESHNFYPAPGSVVIDASIDSLGDRINLETLREYTGIAASPIIAPQRDRAAQLRVDDPDVPSPTGLGFNVFKDRGAVERADWTGPSAYLVSPSDNDAAGLDQDNTDNRVRINNKQYEEFRIRLVDNAKPISTQFGIGIDDLSVNSGSIDVFAYGNVTLDEIDEQRCPCDEDDPSSGADTGEILNNYTATRLVAGRDFSFSFDSVNDEIVMKSLSGSFPANQLYRLVMRSADGTVMQVPAGNDLPDEAYFDIIDEQNDTLRFEYDSGYVLQIPMSASFILPSDENLSTLDRTIFTISLDGVDTTFEFDTDGSVFGNNLPVSYTPTADADEIAQALVRTLSDADLELYPAMVSLPDDVSAVHLGTNRDHGVVTQGTSPLVLSGIIGVVDQHDSVIVDDGANGIEFYFEFSTATDSTDDFVPSQGVTKSIAVPVSHDMTNEELADTLSDAIAAESLGLSPRHIEDGVMQIGGTLNHFLHLSNAPNLLLTGEPGLAHSPFGIRVLGVDNRVLAVDGDTFQITNSLTSATAIFEFDDNGQVDTNNAIAVNFTNTTTINSMVHELVLEINNAGLSVEAFDAGNGIVSFKDSTGLSVEIGNSANAIVEVGQAGMGPAVGINFTVDQMAGTIAIATANRIDSVGNTLLDGVTAHASVDTVIVNGASVVSTYDDKVLPLLAKAGARDLAGNSLLPNNEEGLVEFLIELGIRHDYGDADDSYRTSKSTNGPAHTVVSGFSLGDEVTAEPDARVDDNDDGIEVIYTSEIANEIEVVELGSPVELSVNVNKEASVGPAYLHGWVDWNRNEVFDEDTEKLRLSTTEPSDCGDGLTALELKDGTTQVWFTAPAAYHDDLSCPGEVDLKDTTPIVPGNIQARFRLTTQMGIAAFGYAPDGEVEDMQIRFGGNPWHNLVNRLDVNGDGHVSPIDALKIITYVNDETSPARLPVPSAALSPQKDGYLDVNEDGYAVALDALNVINHLNANADEGESEAPEGEFYGYLPNVDTMEIPANEKQTSRVSLSSFVVQPVTPEFEREGINQDSSPAATVTGQRNELDDILNLICEDIDDALEDPDGHDDFFAGL